MPRQAVGRVNIIAASCLGTFKRMFIVVSLLGVVGLSTPTSYHVRQFRRRAGDVRGTTSQRTARCYAMSQHSRGLSKHHSTVCLQ